MCAAVNKTTFPIGGQLDIKCACAGLSRTAVGENGSAHARTAG